MKTHDNATNRSMLLRALNHEVTSRAPLDEAALLAKVLQAMNEEDQSILVPYYAHGFDAVEIGRALGISDRAVHGRIRKALRRTRRKLGVKVCE